MALGAERGADEDEFCPISGSVSVSGDVGVDVEFDDAVGFAGCCAPDVEAELWGEGVEPGEAGHNVLFYLGLELRRGCVLDAILHLERDVLEGSTTRDI